MKRKKYRGLSYFAGRPLPSGRKSLEGLQGYKKCQVCNKYHHYRTKCVGIANSAKISTPAVSSPTAAETSSAVAKGKAKMPVHLIVRRPTQAARLAKGSKIPKHKNKCKDFLSRAPAPMSVRVPLFDNKREKCAEPGRVPAVATRLHALSVLDDAWWEGSVKAIYRYRGRESLFHIRFKPSGLQDKEDEEVLQLSSLRCLPQDVRCCAELKRGQAVLALTRQQIWMDAVIVRFSGGLSAQPCQSQHTRSSQCKCWVLVRISSHLSRCRPWLSAAAARAALSSLCSGTILRQVPGGMTAAWLTVLQEDGALDVEPRRLQADGAQAAHHKRKRARVVGRPAPGGGSVGARLAHQDCRGEPRPGLILMQPARREAAG